jgi:hypothetical protein
MSVIGPGCVKTLSTSVSSETAFLRRSFSRVFQTLGLIHLQAAVLTAPLVVGLLRSRDAAADLATRLACPSRTSASRRNPMIFSVDLPFRAMSASPNWTLEKAGLAPLPWFSPGRTARRGFFFNPAGLC